MPAAARAVRGSTASIRSHAPVSSADRCSTVSGSGAAAPGGRQVAQTAPPSGAENASCGQGAPHRAQSVKLGAHPAVDTARSR